MPIVATPPLIPGSSPAAGTTNLLAAPKCVQIRAYAGGPLWTGLATNAIRLWSGGTQLASTYNGLGSSRTSAQFHTAPTCLMFTVPSAGAIAGFPGITGTLGLQATSPQLALAANTTYSVSLHVKVDPVAPGGGIAAFGALTCGVVSLSA